jgi:hypothetical protein
MPSWCTVSKASPTKAAPAKARVRKTAAAHAHAAPPARLPEQSHGLPHAERLAAGKALRSRVARDAFATWQPDGRRADPVDLLKASSAGRVPELEDALRALPVAALMDGEASIADLRKLKSARELALLRELIRTATSTVEQCYDFTGGIEQFVDTLEQQMFAVTQCIDDVHSEEDIIELAPVTDSRTGSVAHGLGSSASAAPSSTSFVRRRLPSSTASRISSEFRVESLRISPMIVCVRS